jgi:hypothetical protein
MIARLLGRQAAIAALQAAAFEQHGDNAPSKEIER